MKLVPKGRINNIPALGQIMAWRRPGDKPLSEPMMVSLLKHICHVSLGLNELKHRWNNHILWQYAHTLWIPIHALTEMLAELIPASKTDPDKTILRNIGETAIM